jgi:hypothetical protein
MPRPHLTPGKDPIPIVQEAGWASGSVWTGAENLAPTGIRSSERPARRQSLYRLRYSAHTYLDTFSKVLFDKLINISRFHTLIYMNVSSPTTPPPICATILFCPSYSRRLIIQFFPLLHKIFPKLCLLTFPKQEIYYPFSYPHNIIENIIICSTLK